MEEYPAAVPAPPKKGLSAGAILGIVFGSLFLLGLIVVAVAAVVFVARVDGGSSDGEDAAAPPGRTLNDQTGEADESARAINVAGMPIEVVNGTVTSACFTFDLPTEVEYELNPASTACKASIRIVGTDSLTEISVMAQSGDNRPETFFAAMEDAMAQTGSDDEPVTKSLLIDGRPSVYAMVTDSWGLPKEFYQVPVPEGAFEFDGTAITSILIVSPRYTEGSEFNQSVVDIVESFSLQE